MARRAVLAFALVWAIGLVVVLWRAGADQRPVAFSLGGAPVRPVAMLDPGHEVCQAPITLQVDASGVTFFAGAKASPGMPLELTVRDADVAGGRPLATRQTPGGYPDHATRTVRFPTLRAGRAITVCIRNRGGGTAYPYGDDQVPDTGTVVDGRRQPIDITLRFLRERPRSALSLVPTMFRRASLFRFGFVGAWTFWALAAALALAVPLLCAFALARAARGAESPGDAS